MDNFNIREFLTENKVTIASQRLEEADSYGMPGSTVVKEKKSGSGDSAPKAPKAPKADGESKSKEEDDSDAKEVFDCFKDLSKEQQVKVAKQIAKHLKPKPKKAEKEEGEEEIDEELVGGQKELDKDGDGEISGADFKLMKKK
jgi:hypothetical protein